VKINGVLATEEQAFYEHDKGRNPGIAAFVVRNIFT
jgi:hypothetical protein